MARITEGACSLLNDWLTGGNGHKQQQQAARVNRAQGLFTAHLARVRPDSLPTIIGAD